MLCLLLLLLYCYVFFGCLYIVIPWFFISHKNITPYFFYLVSLCPVGCIVLCSFLVVLLSLFYLSVLYMCVYICMCVSFMLHQKHQIIFMLNLTSWYRAGSLVVIYNIWLYCYLLFVCTFYQNRKNISTLLLYVRSKAYSRSTPHPASRAQIQSCGTWTSVFGLLFKKAFNKKAFYLRKILLSLQLLLSL